MTPDGPFLPPFPGPWLELSGDERSAFVERLDRHLQAAGLAGPPFSHQCPPQRVHAVPVPFYPGWLMLSVEVRFNEQDLANVDVLMGPGFLWSADGQSTMIHTLNAGRVPMPPAPGDSAPRLLASPLAALEPRTTAPQYLRWFCRLVRGEGGSFLVVQSADELRACGVTQDLERLAALLKPLRATWRRDDPAGGPRRVRISAPILYEGSLHQARFEVDPSGQVTMLDDQRLAQNVAPVERTRHWLRSIRGTSPVQPI